MLPSVSVTTPSVMVLETNILRENYASQSQPVHLRENHLKPSRNMKDHELIPFEGPSSHGSFLQDDFHHIDQFHVNASSSSNAVFGVQNTPNFDPFGNATCECAPPTEFEDYEGNPNFAENNNAHLIDSFQYDNGYSLNLPRRNRLDMMVVNQSYPPFNPTETNKSVNYVVPDDVSCITPSNYYRRVGLNKNYRESPTSRRTFKGRKKSNTVKGQWTVDEDRLLIQLVEQYGMRKWSHIAQKLPGRIGKQCRERWHNHLRPDIKKDIWTDEEDKILIQAHAEIGNKWAEIAKRLPGRTENSIKNHWNATRRRQYSKRKCRSKYPRGTLLQEYIKSLNLDQNPPRDFRKKSSSNAKKNNTSKGKAAAAQTQPQNIADHQFCNSSSNVHHRLVQNYDFNNEVPDFCLDDDNLFEKGCGGIDSLLDDDMHSAPNMDGNKDFDGKMQSDPTILEGEQFDNEGGMQVVDLDHEHHFERMEVKKELDLVEMISQVNESIS